MAYGRKLLYFNQILPRTVGLVGRSKTLGIQNRVTAVVTNLAESFPGSSFSGMAFANSKTEDYVRKVNRLHDIYLERELHHLENERKFYLETFRTEYRVAREKRDKITSKAKEYRRLRELKSQDISPVERSASGTKQAVFITETGLEKYEVQP